ncbi:hypothetical protein EMIT0P43_150076 [Pseudomonas jessenii]
MNKHLSRHPARSTPAFASLKPSNHWGPDESLTFIGSPKKTLQSMYYGIPSDLQKHKNASHHPRTVQ